MIGYSDVRGRVWRDRFGTWVYVVVTRGDVVLTDNCSSWQQVYEFCARDVESVDRIVRAGHRLLPWQEVVDRTPTP